MGVREHRGQIICDVRWPDKTRFQRVCANKTEAQRLHDQVKGAIATGTWRDLKAQLQLRNRDTVTVEEFSETYMEQYAKVRNTPKAWKRKETCFNSINRFMGKVALEDVSPALLHNYVKKRSKDVSASTINRDLTVLKHMLNYAVEIGIIPSNPVEKFKNLKEDRKERPRFTDEEIQKVIDAVRSDCRPLFIFIRETGCRREEALSLKHSQIQENSQMVVFTDTKSRRFRYVPLTEEALAAVKALPKLDGCEYVFYSQKTKDRWHNVKKVWESARTEAELPELQIKDLRRHYAIKLAESGAAMHDIQQVLGHTSVTTTEKYYAHFSPNHSARKILRVLEGGKSVDTKRIHRAEAG